MSIFSYNITSDRIFVTCNGEYYSMPKTPKNIQIVSEMTKRPTEPTLDEVKALTSPQQYVDEVQDDRFYWSSRNHSKRELFVKGIDRPIPKRLAKRFIELLNADAPVDSFLRFWVNCNWNPNYESVEMLFKFLENKHLPITSRGLFLGYRVVQLAPYYVKGEDNDAVEAGISYRKDIRDSFDKPYVETVRIDPDTGEVIDNLNLTQRLRFVDRYTGQMDNSIGEVVDMERSEVVFDPESHCDTGLHIGAFQYLPRYGAGSNAIQAPRDRDWHDMAPEEQYAWIRSQKGDPVTENLVHPANVVSVPEYTDFMKLRCCEFFVLRLFNGPHVEPHSSIDVGYGQYANNVLREKVGPPPEVEGITV